MGRTSRLPGMAMVPPIGAPQLEQKRAFIGNSIPQR
jgi:hypothetical protein